MTAGVILAGGRGSRLGPLAAQISKALVSIGQQPHIAHQVELLRANGCGQIVVVTSPETHEQIRLVAGRACLDVTLVAQGSPTGPVDAVATGLGAVARADDDVLVIMSDTFLDVREYPGGTWYGVAQTAEDRSFCYAAGDGAYIDGIPGPDRPVTVGFYRFHDAAATLALAAEVYRSEYCPGHEVGMGPFLTAYARENDVRHVDLSNTWMDIGDVHALAVARRTRFISRETHSLDMSYDGTITKAGSGSAFRAQRDWMLDVFSGGGAHGAETLVPRVYRSTDTSYTMDYIDLPTLSELWLYWPGRVDTWQQILRTIIDRMDSSLWDHALHGAPASGPPEAEHAIFVEKASARLLSKNISPEWRNTLAPLVQQVAPVFTGSAIVHPHGDLNWNNILFSLNTSSFKLVDPRGDKELPIAYELAKLSYSWTGFAEITHNLHLHNRVHERAVLDEVLAPYISLEKLRAAEGCLFIAGAPLHDPVQRERMLSLGASLLEGVLSHA